MTKKVGLLLSGCGYLDGAEIRESVLSLLALDRLGIEVIMLSLNEVQHQTVSHLKSEEEGSSRNIMTEAARIARGKIQEINTLNANDLDGLVIPGGYGVAKNFSDFAFKGANGKMHPEVQKLIIDINNQNKPIAAICISPAVICLALGQKHPELTIGNDPQTIEVITVLGGKHFTCKPTEVHVDEKLKIVSTPAYMYDDAPISEIAEGIDKCMEKFNQLL